MATDLELFYLELFNSARSNPEEYAASLGIDLNEGLPDGTISPDAKQPLILNSDLTTLAVNHSQDMLDNDFFSHDSPTTGSTKDRFDASSYTYSLYGENISLVPSAAVLDLYDTAQLMFETLFIDAGVDGRGHRKSILSRDFSELGIGHLIGDWSGDAESHVLTHTFGYRVKSTQAVVGTVFEDANSNGEFDIGEGLPGIDVAFIQNSTDKYVVSTGTNGYFEAEVLPGDYTVEARTPDHYSTVEISVANVNQRVLLFWDDTVTEAPSGYFSTDADAVLAKSGNKEFNSLNPVNVDSPSGDYTISWDISGATAVFLNGDPVGAVGDFTVIAGGATVYELYAYGPAGQFRQTLPISGNVFRPFAVEGVDEEGKENKTVCSGHPLYGPSNLRSRGVLTPRELYVRIASVVRVSVRSRELDIIFLDGDTRDQSIYRAEAVFGVAQTTPVSGGEEGFVEDTVTPSAAVFAKGDRVAVMVDGRRNLVVSRLDTFHYSNSNRAAIYPGRLLVDAMSTFFVGAVLSDTGGHSYADFIDPWSSELVRVEAQNTKKEENRIAYRLFRQLTGCHLQNLTLIEVDDLNKPYERCGGGPIPTQPVHLNGTVRHGNAINYMPYVIDKPFGSTDYSGGLSAYSNARDKVELESCHPLVADTLQNWYKGATFMWFDDEEPEWVLMVAVYPTWELCKHIKFIEVPVHGWVENSINDSDDPDIKGDRSNYVEYRRYEDLVRELHSLERDWVDWNTVATVASFSETAHRALCVPAIKTGPNEYKFVIHDGYGYSDGAEIFYGLNEQKLMYGKVTRSVREEGLASNGSPYEYDISYDSPLDANTKVSLWYELDYRYYKDATDVWESQHTTAETEERMWVVYTDGRNRLLKKVWIDYYCDGEYAFYPWNSTSWGGDVSAVESIDNQLKEYIYWNGESTLVTTYDFRFQFDGLEFFLNQSIPVFHYANIEEGLFVIEFVEMYLRNSYGPNYPLTDGTRSRTFKVWYRGDVFTLFSVDIPFKLTEPKDNFPELYNFWPWILDALTPPKPETPTYDETFVDDTISYLSPFAGYYVEPISPYVFSAVSYPTIQGDVSSALFVGSYNTDQEDLRSDYLQVFIDPKSDSWGVTVKNLIEIKEDRSISFPDGGGSTADWPHGMNSLYKIGGGSPTFTKPPVSKTYTL